MNIDIIAMTCPSAVLCQPSMSMSMDSPFVGSEGSSGNGFSGPSFGGFEGIGGGSSNFGGVPSQSFNSPAAFGSGRQGFQGNSYGRSGKSQHIFTHYASMDKYR